MRPQSRVLLSPNRRQRITASISTRTCALFVGLLVLACANIMIARALLRDLNGVAETVNVAGRLRMLSQQIAYRGSVALHDGDAPARAALTASIADYDAALAALKSGGPAFGYTVRRPSAAIAAQLAALDSEWQRARPLHRRLLAAQPGADGAQLAAQVGLAQRVQLERAEALTLAWTRAARQTQDDALERMYLLLALDVLLLALAFARMRRKLVMPLRALARQSGALARGDYQARVRIDADDEIGALAQAFNHSAQRIGHLVADMEIDRLSIRQAELTFRGLADNSVVGVYIVRDERFHFVNPKMAEMFGYERQEMIDSAAVGDIVIEQERDFVELQRQKRISGEVREVRYERRARRRDGSTFEVEVYGSSMQIDGRPSTIGIILDITERKRAERALHLQNACAEALIRATDEAALLAQICAIVHDVGGHQCAWVEYAGQRGAPAALAGVERRLPAGASVLTLALASGGADIGILGVCAADHSAFTADERHILERLADNLAYGVAALRVEVARKRYEQQLEYGANYDALTGLANRNLLSDRLRQAMAGAVRKGNMVGVLLHDLDNFKVINDSLGHDAGDALLKAVAQRMRAAVREADTVARLGGDEFVIVIADVDSAAELMTIAGKLLADLARPFTIEHQQIYISASIGICLYPRDGEQEQILLKNVDLAMYRAKREGRNTVRFFTEELNADNRERQKLEAALHTALEQGQFELHYQPKFDYASGAVTGMEALVRWNHPQLGVIAPAAFIPLAEEIGLIERLGAWVLHSACRQNRALQDAGVAPLVVAVNLSARQLSLDKLVRTVAAALADSGLAPEYLELELTETAIMHDAANAIAILSDLKALGVRLSLDDFGTGYSSLDYLRRFPFDSIKIDRSFIVGVGEHANDRAIVKTIIALASNLNMNVIAEGVEHREQAEFLIEHACREMQGFLFARPLPAEQLGVLLAGLSASAAGSVQTPPPGPAR